MAIAIHEIANISAIRLERLVNVKYSNGLPAFLVKEPGPNMGFMIPHVTAAALGEKVLTENHQIWNI